MRVECDVADVPGKVERKRRLKPPRRVCSVSAWRLAGCSGELASQLCSSVTLDFGRLDLAPLQIFSPPALGFQCDTSYDNTTTTAAP